MTPDPNDVDRKRGIFSTADRRYLSGDYEGNSQPAEYKRQNAIESRFKNGILDLAFSMEYIDELPYEESIGQLSEESVFRLKKFVEMAEAKHALTKDIGESHEES